MSERIDDLGINNLKLIQNKNYFCFGTDSTLLANFVESNSSKNVILELCSGSGVIPIIMSAKKKYNKIIGVELQQEMFELFEKNIKYNNLENSIIPINENIKEYNNIKKIIEKEVDIIVVNPPYKAVGTGILHEKDVKNIARHEIECTLEDVFLSSSKLLKHKGKLYIVHKPERLADLLVIARKYKFEPKKIQLVYPRIDLKPSIVLIEYIKDGGNELKILEPLIEYNEKNEYTEQFLKIYGLGGNKID